jgi:hypothetical protein
MEQDLRSSLERHGLDRDDEAIRLRGETVIRNYDPRISCATHFLKVKAPRGGTSAIPCRQRGRGCARPELWSDMDRVNKHVFCLHTP